MPVTIRPSTPTDDPTLATIIATAMAEFGIPPAATDPHSIHREYSAANAIYYVAERDAEILGGAGIVPIDCAIPATCELRKMYLSPAARGHGVGTALLEHCLQFARDQGYGHCYLETLPRMAAARKLYERFGFAARSDALTGESRCSAYYLLDLSGK